MAWYRRLWNLVRTERVGRDLDDELSFHVQEREDDLVEAGMARDEARRVARRQFGSHAVGKEQTRDMDVLGSIEGVVKDLRFAIRSLSRRPVFALSAVVTLALGIGASTVIFSVVNAVILRPLPYSNAGDLIRMYGRLGDRLGQASVTPDDFLDYRNESRTFSGIAASVTGLIPMTATGIPQPLRLEAALVSGNYFDVFDQDAVLGRRLTMDDENAASPPVAVISRALWQEVYEGRENAIGEALRLTGPFVDAPVIVVGVMPEEFDAPYDPDIWLPMPMANTDLHSRSAHFFSLVGRLAPGVPENEAQQELDTIAARLEQEYPATNEGWSLNLVPFRDTILGGSRGPLAVLSIAVALLLLIACSNAANLLLASLATRTRELSTRVALGAGRLRLARLLVLEAGLLGALACAAGVLLAYWATKVIADVGVQRIPRLSETSIDGFVLAFAVVLSLATVVAVGLVPSLRAGAPGRAGALRSATDALGKLWASRLLVAGQMAVCLTLLVGSGLTLRSFVNLVGVDPGFDPAARLTFDVTPPESLAESARQTYLLELGDRIERVPGVDVAGWTSELPLSGRMNDWPFYPEGSRPASSAEQVTADYRRINDTYFQAMGIPIMRGRTFTRDEVVQRRDVAVVDETLANGYFPDESAIGERIVVGSGDLARTYEIVGVVRGILHRALDAPPFPTIYVPDIATPAQTTLVVRPGGVSGLVANQVREAILEVDPNQPVLELGSYAVTIGRGLEGSRLATTLIAVFATIGLALAAIGLYGVLALSTSRRTREIGIRIALGSPRQAVLRLIVADGLKLALIGTGLGLAGGYVLARVMQGMLFEVTTTDPVTFVSAPFVLLFVSLLAAYVPGRRAAGVDPMMSLRSE